MELSLGAVIGAAIGAILGVANFAMLAPMINEKLRAAAAKTGEGRQELENRISAARRGILAFDMLVFMGAGYWAGKVLIG